PFDSEQKNVHVFVQVEWRSLVVRQVRFGQSSPYRFAKTFHARFWAWRKSGMSATEISAIGLSYRRFVGVLIAGIQKRNEYALLLAVVVLWAVFIAAFALVGGLF